jgi:hypothetical protein
VRDHVSRVRPANQDEVDMNDPRTQPTQLLGREPDLVVSPAVLARYNARVLDPSMALQVAGQPAPRPTVYLADRLLVSGTAEAITRDALTEAARRNGLTIIPPLVDPAKTQQRAELARRVGIAGPSPIDTIAVHLVTAGPAPAVAPDAWTVLQTYRALIGREALGPQRQVALDHLITSTRHTHGTPVVPGAGGAPLDSYGLPGWGGRAPVAWVGAAPARNPDFAGRRPVVAVLDTGVGKHPWFDGLSGLVTRNPDCHGTPMGLQDAATDPEVTGVITDPLEGVLDSDSGHGTFIAGLIHQGCPDANILSVRVMPSDGAVPEHVLLEALNLLALRQQLAQQPGGDPADIVDVVSLSLGYYHEQPEDVSFDPLLLQPLTTLSQLGVAVVAAAGNDATDRPMFPAAFTQYPGATAKDRAPIVSVGALNPDGTIALFSNGGQWVSCFRTGASVVSTFPTTFDGSAQAAFRLHANDGWRSSIDPDSFAGGFGTWSGTSFAAPVLAAELAASIAAAGCESVDPPSMVGRGWAAVTHATKLSPS